MLSLVARASTNRESAAELFLSPLTVKTHVSRVLAKLDPAAPHEALLVMVLAYRAGLLSP